ncbi:hypothetical protein BDZ89DRAFT_1136635 [Hymenopellis radicata]|nr:hypothetical protein BDZ89DRAFT_1136635 [Hymenopellis radicata]
MTRPKASAGKRGPKTSEAGSVGTWDCNAAIHYHIRYGHLPNITDDLDHVPDIPTDAEVKDWEEAEGIRLATLSKEDAQAERDNLKKFGAKIIAWFRSKYLNTSR